VTPSGTLSAEPARGDSRLLSSLRSVSIQDWLVLSYALGLNLAALLSPAGPIRDHCLVRVGGLLFLCIFTLITVRGRLLPGSFAPALMYRVGMQGTVQVSYFFFREFLPQVNPRSVDAQLHTAGVALFGAEPSLSLDAFVNPSSSEWFAFFYFAYFFVLATHVLPILFLGKDQRLLGEFTFGLIFVFVLGHTLYMFVPGWGPIRAVANEFHHQLPSGLWLNVVMDTVAEGGALKDIFPSLHTAAPTFILLFSFRNRVLPPFRYTWPVVLFFVVNIIVATMFLRWHWIVDVVAGLALAVAAQMVGERVTRFEIARRLRDGLEPQWPPFRGVR